MLVPVTWPNHSANNSRTIRAKMNPNGITECCSKILENGRVTRPIPAPSCIYNGYEGPTYGEDSHSDYDYSLYLDQGDKLYTTDWIDQLPELMPSSDEIPLNYAAGENNMQDSGSAPPAAKRSRTVFTSTQLMALENEFCTNKYLLLGKRREMAVALNLSEQQIKVWYQNRRMKLKKGHSKISSPSSSCSTSNSGTNSPHETISPCYCNYNTVIVPTPTQTISNSIAEKQTTERYFAPQLQYAKASISTGDGFGHQEPVAAPGPNGLQSWKDTYGNYVYHDYGSNNLVGYEQGSQQYPNGEVQPHETHVNGGNFNENCRYNFVNAVMYDQQHLHEAATSFDQANI